tara:strand:+ start:964 stop:1377 length:414 start_codon:yes stop_codon:yes gene_type:complete
MKVHEWIILILTVLVSILLPNTSWKCDSLGRMVSLIMILLSSVFVPKYGITVALLLMLSVIPCLSKIDIYQQVTETFANKEDEDNDDDNESSVESITNKIKNLSRITKRKEAFQNQIKKINHEIKGLEEFYSNLGKK